MSNQLSQSYSIRVVAAIAVLAVDICALLFISPVDLIGMIGEIPTVVVAITIQGILAYLISSLFLKNIDQFCISIGIVCFLSLTYVFGFQILNTILLLLFIITLRMIVQREK